MPTYTQVVVFEAEDDAAATAVMAKTLKIHTADALVDERLSDADGNVIEHRSTAE